MLLSLGRSGIPELVLDFHGSCTLDWSHFRESSLVAVSTQDPEELRENGVVGSIIHLDLVAQPHGRADIHLVTEDFRCEGFECFGWTV